MIEIVLTEREEFEINRNGKKNREVVRDSTHHLWKYSTHIVVKVLGDVKNNLETDHSQMFVDDYQYISFCLLQLACKASLSYTTCTSMETSLVPDIAYIYCTVPINIILNSIQHIPLCNLNTIYRFSREQRLIKAYLVYTVYTSHFLDLIKCSREAVPLLPWLAIKGGFSEGTKDKSM